MTRLKNRRACDTIIGQLENKITHIGAINVSLVKAPCFLTLFKQYYSILQIDPINTWWSRSFTKEKFIFIKVSWHTSQKKFEKVSKIKWSHLLPHDNGSMSWITYNYGHGHNHIHKSQRQIVSHNYKFSNNHTFFRARIIYLSQIIHFLNHNQPKIDHKHFSSHPTPHHHHDLQANWPAILNCKYGHDIL